MNRAYLRPPLPLYRTAALLLGLPLLLWLAYLVSVNRFGPLQRLYWHDYLRSTLTLLPTLPTFGPAAAPKPEYELMVVYGPPGREQPVTVKSSHRISPFAMRLADVPMAHSLWHDWLTTNIYGGRAPVGFFLLPVMGALFVCSLLAGLGYFLDQNRLVSFRSRKARHIKGPELVTPAEFNSRVKGDGVGFRVDRGRWRNPGLVRIQRDLEAQHQLMQGDNGAGKTVAMFSLADQFEAMGETCIYYDPDGQFLKRYWKPGDIILGADQRSASWSPADEIDYSTTANAAASAMSQAESLYPGREGTKDFFFTNCSRMIYKHAMTNYRPNAAQLAEIICHADPLLDAIAKGNELEEMLKKNTEGLRASIISTLTQCLFALQQVPAEEPGVQQFSAREYVAMTGRRPSIFFTASEETKAAFAPLHRLWIDSLIRQFLSQPEQPYPVIRIFLDELPALGELSNLETATSRGRKRGIDLILGFQGRSQIQEIYGKLSEAIFSAPFTKLLLHTGEPEGGEWASKTIGEEEAEWVVEHVNSDGQRSYTTQTKIGRIVPQSDLGSLENRHGYLRYAGYVVKLKLALPPARPERTLAFVARTGTPPEQLPMPNLEAIRAKEAADKKKAAERAAARPYPYQPPSTAQPEQTTEVQVLFPSE